jgi:hypothetical protein
VEALVGLLPAAAEEQRAAGLAWTAPAWVFRLVRRRWK